MKKTVRLLFVGGLFFVIDQVLKCFSLNIWPTKNLLYPYFGWFPFKNPGVAFGIPVPFFVVVSMSVLILCLLIYLLKNSGQNSLLHKLGLVLIIFGAASNLLDRITLGFTADYLLILTSVINLADVMIVCGFGLFVFTLKKTRPAV